jgi:AcrR family transcriptional regulator
MNAGSSTINTDEGKTHEGKTHEAETHEDEPAARPGRHRSEAVDEAIVAATVELLGERGYNGVTMAAVIERAGVSSATLYRRFSRKEELVAAAVATLAPAAIDIDTGTLAGDIKAFVGVIARAVTNRREDVLDALSLEAKRNPELYARLRTTFLEPRLAMVHDILARARERGELAHVPADDVALSLVTGACYHRAFVLNEPLTPSFQRAAVEAALAGLRDARR